MRATGFSTPRSNEFPGRTCSPSASPSYRAWVRSPRDKRLIRKTFQTLREEKHWRDATKVDLRRGAISAPKPLTIETAAEAWLKGAKSGAVRNRSGQPYKPSVIRGYEQGLRLHLLPVLGKTKLSELRRADVQRFADKLIEDGMTPSTVRNALMPLRSYAETKDVATAVLFLVSAASRMITGHTLPPGLRSQLGALFELTIFGGEFWHRLITILKPLLWPYAVGSTFGALLLALCAYPLALAFVTSRRRIRDMIHHSDGKAGRQEGRKERPEGRKERQEGRKERPKGRKPRQKGRKFCPSTSAFPSGLSAFPFCLPAFPFCLSALLPSAVR